MARKSKPVYRFDADRNQLDKYDSMQKAGEALGLPQGSMAYYIYSGKPCKGFFLTFNPNGPNTEPKEVGEYPWEVNGFFCAKVWLKAFIY